MLRFGSLAVMAVTCLVAAAAPARAGLLTITVTGSAGGSFTVVDGGVGDGNPGLNAINVEEAIVQGAFAGQLTTQSSFTAVTNQATSAVDGFSNLGTTAALIRTAAGADITFTITASQTDFSVPVGPAKTYSDTLTGNFTNAPAGDSVSLEGGVDTANALGTFSISNVLTIVNPGAPDPFSDAENGGPIGFVDPNLFSITSVVTAFTTANSDSRPTSSVVVSAAAVPAPAGLALAAVALPAIALRRLVRRKA